MRIIISPAKKMNVDTDSLPCQGLPAFLPRTERLLAALRAMDAAELKRLWKCNDQIAALNLRRLEAMDLRRNLTPAILSYEGIQYQYMAPGVFTSAGIRLCPGASADPVGLLRPAAPLRRRDPLPPGDAGQAGGGRGQRTSMPSGATPWPGSCAAETDCILNLASKEYSLCVSKHLEPSVRFITCVFGEETGGRILEKGTLCKMARGEMVRYLAEHRITEPEAAKGFDRLGYRYAPTRSDGNTYVFLRSEDSRR